LIAALQLFPQPKRKVATTAETASEYAPLTSIWYGEDAELLERLLSFYPRRKPRRILDVTVNGGRF